MSQGNVEIVRRFLDRAHADPDRVWGIFDDSVVWEIGPLRIPDLPPTSHGPEQVREFFRRWAGSFEDWDFEAEEPVPVGRNGVLVRIQQWGRGKGSGARVEVRLSNEHHEPPQASLRDPLPTGFTSDTPATPLQLHAVPVRY
jgi:SnoaL-like domain